jgi:hypothetical protein
MANKKRRSKEGADFAVSIIPIQVDRGPYRKFGSVIKICGTQYKLYFCSLIYFAGHECVSLTDTVKRAIYILFDDNSEILQNRMLTEFVTTMINELGDKLSSMTQKQKDLFIETLCFSLTDVYRLRLTDRYWKG